MTLEKNACGVARTSSQTLIKFVQDNDGFFTNGSQLISSSTVSQATYTWTPVLEVAAVAQQYEESVITGGGQNMNNNVVLYNQSGQLVNTMADVHASSNINYGGLAHVPQTIQTYSVAAANDIQEEYFHNGGYNINNSGLTYSQNGQNASRASDVFGSGIISSGGVPHVPVLPAAYFSNGGQQVNNGGNLAANCVNQNNNVMQQNACSLTIPATVEGAGAPIAVSVTGKSLTYVGQNRAAVAVYKREDAVNVLHAANADSSVGSAASTVEDGAINEASDEPTDLTTEPMAFLQGLNSGNLMQFSQQSVLREMILQDLQCQSNSLPKLESHNIGGYNFSMDLKEPPKSHWVYSDLLNKLYIRMEKTFNVDVQFKSIMPIQPLNLRVFLCFNKDVSGAVLRCQNHLSTEPVTHHNFKMRESLLRCENPRTTYCGSAQGKGISERYSVLVPLNLSRSGSRNGGLIRQTLAFKFVCQNSCLGRKETSLIFCLENSSGDILAQNFIGVKICTCPKRDCTQDVRHFRGANEKKRKSLATSDNEDDNDVMPAKIRRRTVSCKQETESNDGHDADYLPNDWEVSRTFDGQYRLAITCPKKEWLLQNIEGMIKESAAEVLRSPTKPNLRHYANNLLNLKKRALDLL
ncbi:uncharacterized protein LOC6598804 isoform X1 [Drosophila persimilis]|uniref:uncharacterized protein LOC6598804 isoform X1 n=2 Tax=Drosophila persimilis TaxID=7234 RepID=UPI000F095CF0|nr:uncharacterized protein LOC6598804 isoform X1 [Drosophila persimilis]